jgi:hypothetical protein
MFRTVPLSIIRSFSLYTQQWYISYRFADSSRAVWKPVWHIPLLCVQRKTPDDGQRNCPKHAEFYSKNKFEKLVHLVVFITRIYHDARSPERHIISVYCRFVVYKFILVVTVCCGWLCSTLNLFTMAQINLFIYGLEQ